MNGLSLYDKLVGYFVSETDIPDPTGSSYFDKKYPALDEKSRQSILDSLRMILQTRRQPDTHMPLFGIPDILRLYIKSGGASEPIKDEIKETILRYEPRIDRLKISDPKIDSKNLRIELKIEASIRGTSDKEILLTEFSITGWTKVYRVDR